jgi:hypothetical protein
MKKSANQRCIFCDRPASREVYRDSDPHWRPCCAVCEDQRRQNVARSLDQLLAPGSMAFRGRAPIRSRSVRKRSPVCQTQQQLKFFEQQTFAALDAASVREQAPCTGAGWTGDFK